MAVMRSISAVIGQFQRLQSYHVFLTDANETREILFSNFEPSIFAIDYDISR